MEDVIEDFIRRGYFKKYKVQIDQERSPREDDEKRKPIKERITKIHVISGGPVHGGSIHGANASLKEVRHQVNYIKTGIWLTPPQMSFEVSIAKDAKGIIYPHDDSLLVSMQISHMMVYCILVEGGSSANILFMPMFENMGLGRLCLKMVS